MSGAWVAADVGAFRAELDRPLDASIPTTFGDDDVDAFGLPRAHKEPVRVGGFVGDTRQGGSCNCETLHLTPHGNGTHTEGIGHLIDARVNVLDLVEPGLMPALVVTVPLARMADVDDEHAGTHAPDDLVVGRDALEDAVNRARPSGFRIAALFVRTTTDTAKRRARHTGSGAAYFTREAALLVRSLDVMHLLVDLPSLDREDDGGLLSAHRAFFDLDAGARAIDGPPPQRTITELAFLPASVDDGTYALSLGLAPLFGDAVPSRPVFFPLTPRESP